MEENDEHDISRILQKGISLRTMDDVDAIHAWVMKNKSIVKLFQGVPEIIVKTICRELGLVKYSANRVVCRQGDHGDTFFIIVSGEVSLVVLSQKLMEEKGIQAEDDEAHGEIGYPKDKRGEFGKYIKSLTSGDTFGEAAVLDPTAKRSCTIITDVVTQFICLKRGAYQRLVRTDTRLLGNNAVEYLMGLYFFRDWTREQLVYISDNLRKVHYKPGDYIVKSGLECNGIIFIVTGDAMETIPMVVYANDGHDLKYFRNDDCSKATNYLLRTNPKLTRRTINLELTSLKSNDICSEYGAILNKKMHQIDITAVTEVEAYYLDNEIWFKALDTLEDAAYFAFKKILLRVGQSRENWRNTRIQVATTHPGLLLTLTVSQLMEHGNLACGWCGEMDHLTGAYQCPQAIKDREQQHIAAENIRIRNETAQKRRIEQQRERERVAGIPESYRLWKQHRKNLMFKIHLAIITSRLAAQTSLTSKEELGREWEMYKLQTKGNDRKTLQPRPARKRFPILKLPASHIKTTPARASNIHDTESVYKSAMLKSLKSIKTVSAYNNIRSNVIKKVDSEFAIRDKVMALPKKPEVPKTSKCIPNRIQRRRIKYDKYIDRRMKRVSAFIASSSDMPPTIEESILY